MIIEELQLLGKDLFNHNIYVQKRFANQLFRGIVKSYDIIRKLFWIIYTDGDREELNYDELLNFIVMVNIHFFVAL